MWFGSATGLSGTSPRGRPATGSTFPRVQMLAPRYASLPQDRPNGRCGDLHAHTSQLTDDPLIAPTRVLTGNPQDEFAGAPRDRGPAGTAPRVGPPSLHKPAMPTQQRVRTDEERLLARSLQEPAGRGQKDPVGLLQTGTSDLTAKNRQLVAEHDDLELLELTRTQTQGRHRERPPKQQIHQRHQQGQTPSDQDADEARLYGRELS